MRALTGRDEMAFHEHRGGPHGRLLALARGLGLAPEGDPTLAEWEERLLVLRRCILGPRVEAEASCPACSARVALIFPADDLPRADPAEAALPPLRLSHLLALEAAGAQGEAALRLLLDALDGDAAELAGPGREALLRALEARAAGLGLEIGTACTDCGAPMVLAFDVAAFLDAELRARTARLLDEVHTIAATYHWGEDEILALPVARRQAYLERIFAAEILGTARRGAG